jgi:hypothetical protein
MTAPLDVGIPERESLGPLKIEFHSEISESFTVMRNCLPREAKQESRVTRALHEKVNAKKSRDNSVRDGGTISEIRCI